MTGDGKVAGWTQVNGKLTDSLPLSDRGLAYDLASNNSALCPRKGAGALA